MKSNIFLKPYITEKTSKLLEKNKFVFLNSFKSNKIELQQVIQKKYQVEIESINILKKPSKRKNRGRIFYNTKLLYKVIVTLKNENNIENLKKLF